MSVRVVPAAPLQERRSGLVLIRAFPLGPRRFRPGRRATIGITHAFRMARRHHHVANRLDQPFDVAQIVEAAIDDEAVIGHQEQMGQKIVID